MVDSHLRNIPVKLFQNLSTDLAEEVIKSLFLFIALAAILFNIVERFEHKEAVLEEKSFKARSRQRTDNGQRLITIAHHEHFVLR